MLTSKDNAIEESLRRSIAAAVEGARLPSVRSLSTAHQASALTVQRVITRLAQEGVIDARPGVGTFVATRPSAAPADYGWQTVALGSAGQPGHALAELTTSPPAGAIGLNTGYPDASLQPLTLLAAATSAAARRAHTWTRQPPEGTAALRTWFAADAGGSIRPDDVVIVSGGQAGLTAAMRGLAEPGDAVVLESPTYLGAIDAATMAGLRIVPVPTDADGVRPDLLEAALRTSGARLVYLQPVLANPTGATLATERRAAVLEAARTHGAFVIEDDYVRDLLPPGEQPSPLARDDADGHIVYLRSLTKSAAPGLRIAGLCARGPALQRLRTARAIDDFFVSGVLQEAALDVVTSPSWPRHLTRLRRAIDARLTVAVAALATSADLALERVPRGGFLVWARLRDDIDETDYVQAARDVGVQLSGGRQWHVSEPAARHIRISVAAASVDEVAEAMRRLATLRFR